MSSLNQCHRKLGNDGLHLHNYQPAWVLLVHLSCQLRSSPESFRQAYQKSTAIRHCPYCLPTAAQHRRSISSNKLYVQMECLYIVRPSVSYLGHFELHDVGKCKTIEALLEAEGKKVAKGKSHSDNTMEVEKNSMMCWRQ